MKRAAVSLVTRLNGKLLVVWNQTHKSWTLPGGKVEDGEPLHAAQRRELREETGLRTAFAVQTYEAPTASRTGDTRQVHVFFVCAVGEPREGEEGSPVCWLTHEELMGLTPYAEFYRTMFDKLAEERS